MIGRPTSSRITGKSIFHSGRDERASHVALETQAMAQRIVHGPAAAPAHGSAAITFGMYPFLPKLFADGGYQGQAFRKALAKALPHFEIEIVKRPDHAKGFEVLLRPWFAERAFACSAFATPLNFV